MNSSPNFEVVSAHTCPYVQRVTIALKEKGIDYTHRYVDLKNKPDWFNKISPFGKVPLLKINEDHVLFESQVINEYLDDAAAPRMHPADPFERAENRAWIELVSSIIMSFGGYYYAKDEDTMNNRIKIVQERLSRLNAAMSDGPFFNGPDFSMIDAAAAPLFARIGLINRYHPINILAPFNRLTSWSKALLERKSVREIITDDFQSRCISALKEKRVFIDKYLKDAA